MSATSSVRSTPAPGPSVSSSTARRSRPFMALYKKLFSDRPERSKLLRALTFAASASASASLAYVTDSIWPLAALPAFAAAHLSSYATLKRRLPLISLIVAAIIVTAGVVMRYDLVFAIRGDRVPVAYFLLIASCSAAFEARTRAGLYTQLVFSALIMFFASELAFGNEFAIFLGLYLIMVIAFLAAAHRADMADDAEIAPFEGRAASALYWTGTVAALVLAAVVAFLVLPWDTSQTPQAAQMAVMPFNGVEEGVQPGVTPSEARSIMQSGRAGSGSQAGRPQPAAGQGGDQESRAPQTLSGDAAGAGTSTKPDDIVAYVRSPVASYWRSESFDSYVTSPDGSGRWVNTIGDVRQFGQVLPGAGEGQEHAGRYLQTYFLQQDLDAPLSGYDPLAWALPWDGRSQLELKAGDTYQVVSKQPEMSSDALRADRAPWLREEYSWLPRDFADMHALTGAITSDARSDFDRAAAIAAYLHSLKYDPKSESPLMPNSPLREFVTGEKPGSAIDFATAAALMARSAGLQSRVITGYLPGEFNPYSGASTVTGGDAHAWAEVYFMDAGWVPFDASSRPDLPVPGSVTKLPPRGFSYLLEHRFGDSLASAASKTPSGAKAALSAFINYWQFFATGLGVIASVSTAVWWLLTGKRRRNERQHQTAYSRIDGPQRRDILRAFARAEKSLARHGFRRRLKTEPFLQYALAAGKAGSTEDGDLIPLAELASAAAYSQMPVPAAATARRRMRFPVTRPHSKVNAPSK